MRPLRISVLGVLAVALVTVGCNRQTEPDLTTTLPDDTVTTASPESTTTVEAETTTSATTDDTEVAEEVESYEVVVRTGTDEGEILWVVVPPGNYDAISLQNLVIRLVEETDAVIRELHVFDDAAALEAARIDPGNRTEEEQSLVDQHYLISVTQSNQVRFQGPFEEEGSFILGS